MEHLRVGQSRGYSKGRDVDPAKIDDPGVVGLLYRLYCLCSVEEGRLPQAVALLKHVHRMFVWKNFLAFSPSR